MSLSTFEPLVAPPISLAGAESGKLLIVDAGIVVAKRVMNFLTSFPAAEDHVETVKRSHDSVPIALTEIYAGPPAGRMAYSATLGVTMNNGAGTATVDWHLVPPAGVADATNRVGRQSVAAGAVGTAFAGPPVPTGWKIYASSTAAGVAIDVAVVEITDELAALIGIEHAFIRIADAGAGNTDGLLYENDTDRAVLLRGGFWHNQHSAAVSVQYRIQRPPAAKVTMTVTNAAAAASTTAFPSGVPILAPGNKLYFNVVTANGIALVHAIAQKS